MKNKVLGFIGFVGVLIIFGSFNTREQGMILDLQFVILVATGLMMMFLSSHFAGAMSYQDCSQKEIKYIAKKSKQHRNTNENKFVDDKAC